MEAGLPPGKGTAAARLLPGAAAAGLSSPGGAPRERGPAARLRERIRAAGPIPFAVFMEEALYGDGGYYARTELPIGEAGDFVTGSSLSPLFGRATARLVEALDRELGCPADLLEAGYGSAVHLAALIDALAPPGAEPEPGRSSRRSAAAGDAAGPSEIGAGAPSSGSGPHRRVLAWDRIARPVPEGVERLAALDDLEPGSIDGLVFSYELFDALPVHRLVRRGVGLAELKVGLDEAGGFAWVEGELSDPALAALPGAGLAEGQIADLAPGWRPLYRALAERLGRGLLVTCDYGFTAERLLDPRVRRHGTLACYRRHRVHRDALAEPGAQDLTAHVDFSALIEEGESAGLETVAFTRQAAWLAAGGFFDGLARAPQAERLEAMRLLDLDGMGEEIRVLVQGRGIDAARLLDLALLAGG